MKRKKIILTSLLMMSAVLLPNFLWEVGNTEAGWQANTFLTQEFWDSDWTTGNLVSALFGNGTPGSSPYNRYWTEQNCDIETMKNNIKYITTYNQIQLDNATGNTIYLILWNLLSSSLYSIKPQSCSAFIGMGDVTIKSNNTVFNIEGKSNVIIDNIKIQWRDDVQDAKWIDITTNSKNNTINNVEISKMGVGIEVKNSSNNFLNQLVVHENKNRGVYLNGWVGNMLYSSQIFNHKLTNSVWVYVAWTHLINNTQIYNNRSWLILGYGQVRSWFYLNNSAIYNNYNNYIWWLINNSVIYNNHGNNYVMWVIVNSAIYNNNFWNEWGITGDYCWTVRVFENNWSYSLINNNSQCSALGVFDSSSLITWWLNVSYAWIINPVDSSGDKLITPSMTSWLGYKSWTGAMPIKYIFGQTIPKQKRVLTHAEVTDLTIQDYQFQMMWMPLNFMEWIDRDPSKPIAAVNMEVSSEEQAIIDYYYGEGSEFSQNRSGGSNCSLGSFTVEYINDQSDFNSKLIGTAPMWHTIYVLSGDVFFTQNPIVLKDDCTAIVSQWNAMIMMTGGAGSSWTYNNNPSVTLASASSAESSPLSQKKLISALAPGSNTQYGNSTPTFNIMPWVPVSIPVQRTILIPIQTQNTSRYSNTPADYGFVQTDRPIIWLAGVENVILDNIGLYWNNSSKHGVYLSQVWTNQSSNNNTISNIRAFKNSVNGITLWVWASYNDIMNSQAWNNGKNGIEIFIAGEYNIINNSMSYNNKEYGIRFGNLWHHNTINNSQFFNNWTGGIFADSTTQENILNNIHTYNNGVYGLNFKHSSKNVLHNIYSYNNQIWLNITETSSLDNVYYGVLQFFANASVNLSGTNGNDEFLKKGEANISNWTSGEDLVETGIEMNDWLWVTNPVFALENGGNLEYYWLMSGSIQTWFKAGWNAMLPSYFFGFNISKQIAPVWYGEDDNIEGLNYQHNTESYIGEVNVILYTNPWTITISGGNENNLELNIVHEMEVQYNNTMINTGFDVFLTLDDELSGHLQIQLGDEWHNIWMGQSWVDYETIQWIKILIQTPNEYYKTITWTVYIWTEQYGEGTGSFTITTKPDPTPPTIIWLENIDSNSLRSGESNTWQAEFSWVYTTNATYTFVTWADACHIGVSWITYTGDLKDIVSETNYSELNDQYICVVVRDTINGLYATGLSNQIKISNMEFEDSVETGPVYQDIVELSFQNVENYKYRWVSSGYLCSDSFSWLEWNAYVWPIIVNNISLHNKHICVYWEDGSGVGKYLLSENKLNILDYSDMVHFIDDVSSDWVLSDTIDVYFKSWVNFTSRKYKWIDEAIDCNGSGWMTGFVDYTWAITIDHEDLNWKYFCLYTKQSGIEHYLLSSSDLKIDLTPPETPTIISPTSGQNVYWLVVKTTWAIDDKSWLSGFEYEIAVHDTFLDIVSAWEVNSNWANDFSPVFNKNDREYVIRVKAIDKVGNKSDRSNKVSFNYKNLSGFEFINVVNAQLWTAYVSNKIIMWWLGWSETIEAKVTTGQLCRWFNCSWTTVLVQNADELTIKMVSSSGYNETVETKLIIANRVIPRKITTMNSGFSLTGSLIDSWSCAVISTWDYLNAQSVLTSIVSMYTNETQLKSFLLVMKSMLQDNIMLAGNTGVDNMKCLLYLVDQYLITHFGMGTDPNVHKTPSCKEYLIVHNTGDNTYYSPNTIKQTKFGSRDELIKFLDSNNPWDCHVNTYWNTVSYNSSDPNRHIAPNGKVYRIELNNLWYHSPDFINVKYFATVLELRAFIDKNNPAIIVRDHTVDTTFEPIVHTAPNSKTYKIYKTNRWYMSYKLIKVQYFDTLELLKNHIDKNNKVIK